MTPHWSNIRAHAWQTALVASPMVLSRIGIILMSTVDVLVLGRAGPGPMGDYVLGQALQDSLVAMLIGLLLGVPVLVSRESGAGNDPAAGVIWRRGLSAGAIMGLGLCLTLQFSGYFYTATGQAPDVAERAAGVTRILAFGLPFIAIYYVCTSFLEGLHRPWFGLITIAAGNVLNLCLNIGLVFGMGPFPELGAQGCALATVLTSSILAFGSVFYVRYKMPDAGRYGISKKQAHPVRVPRMREQLFIGTASGGSFLFEASSYVAITTFIAWLGPTALAAHGILFQFLAITFMISYGIAGATQVRVGRAWGQGRSVDVSLAGWTGLGLAGTLTAIFAVLIAANARTLVGLFSTDPQVQALAVPVVIWVVLATAFDGGQTVMNSACRGRGDTWAPTALHFCSYWVIMVPCGWYFAFEAGRGIMGIYQGILIASVMSITFLGMRFHALARSTGPAGIATGFGRALPV